METKDEELGETEKSPSEDAPEGGLAMKICFIIFGIGSLLAWNAILSDISFFYHYLGKYEPSTSFAFFNFALNIVFQFVMIWKKQLISYKTQLIFGLISSIITLIILPIVVTSFEVNSLNGFIVTGIIILYQGLVNAFCCSGFYGLTSFFPLEMIISLSSGQGISGILMNIIGYIVIASVNTGNADDDNKYGAIIFFTISGFILLICLVTLLFAFRTEYFKYYLSKTKDFSNAENNIDKEAIITRSTGGNEDGGQENDGKEDGGKEGEGQLIEMNKDEPKKPNELNFFGLFKLIYDVDLLSCYIYVVTFALFPSVSINQRLFSLGIYRQITIITIYNVGDTIGRSIVSKIKPTKLLSYIVIIGRSILLVTLILNHYFDMQLDMNKTFTSICLIINVSILAITNGIATSLCFGLAPSLVPDEIKGRAGGSVGFFNIFGIFLGTCVAFLSMFIMNKIGEYKDPTN